MNPSKSKPQKINTTRSKYITEIRHSDILENVGIL